MDRSAVEPALASAIKKLTDDLAWRGPNGRPQGNIVLTREQAEAVLEAIQNG